MTHERGSSYEFICQPIIKHKPDALDWIRLRGLVSNERDCRPIRLQCIKPKSDSLDWIRLEE